MLAEHTEPSNRIKDYFQDPENSQAVAYALRTAMENEGPTIAPGELSMLPDFVRTHFVRVFDGDHGKVRGVHTLDLIERTSVYFPVYSRKSARGLRCQDLAEAVLKHLEK